MINFKLKELNKIAPWGQAPELSLHWFGLTDGDLWLNFGKETIYEYSKEAINYWGDKPTPYNDYPLSRFIEDFTEIFDQIREPVPEEFYQLTQDLNKFRSDAKKWLDIYDTNEDNYSDFYFEEYDRLISWTYQRSFDSGHLVGGPCLSFFRRNNKIRIVWDTESSLDNGINLWTARNGNFEMDYSVFVDRIKAFGHSFFTEMDTQVQLALSKDWGHVKVDKQRLAKEHQERKNDFYTSVALLEKEPVNKTDWMEIKQLFNQMTNELK